MKALRTILKTAVAELGNDHEQVVMLKSLLEARLREKGSSIENVSVFTSGTVSIKDE